MGNRHTFAFAAMFGLVVVAASASCTLDTQGALDEPGADSSLGGSGGSTIDGSPKDVSKEGDAPTDKADSNKPDVKPNDGQAEAGCFPGTKWCGGKCVETAKIEYGCAPETCSPCDIPHATPKCANEQCAIEKCTDAFADCKGGVNDGCETPVNTLDNCRTCGTPCVLSNATSECSDGQNCKIVNCTAGYKNCDSDESTGCETYTKGDPKNCNTCGNICTNANPNINMVCVNSTCVIDICPAGQADCDGDGQTCEINTQTDINNCGSCGHACSYPNGIAACVSGVCQMTGCVAPFGDCDKNPANGCEVNLNTSPGHCGSCNAACKSTNGQNPSCDSGLCTLTCDNGWDNCNGPQPGNDPKNDGCEVNIGANPQQCGACNKPCSTANGTNPTCASGKCSLTCNGGYADCDGPASGAQSNGCEISIATDPAHCGACLTVCNNNNGTPGCAGGNCTISCNPGYTDCNTSPSDGCEINTGGDVANCGACGKVCSTLHGSASCNSGTCAISCAQGWGNCDGNADTGCEVDTTNALAHCGACNAACSSNHGTPTCSGSVCSISCSGGWGNCDNNVNNGCEGDLLNDAAHCNACTTPCNIPNATPKCTNGVCGIQTCNPGRADCDGQVPTGCEVNTNTDGTHCGNCSTVCSNVNGTGSCSNGTCVIACNNGYGNCDSNVTNGCETVTTNDPVHCGTCNTVCSTGGSTPHGNRTCNGTTCGFNCSSGWGNCNGNLTDGCESDITTIARCGSCTVACSGMNAVWTCAGGATCAVQSCQSGWGNCDGVDTNGCEVNTTNTKAHCGGCNNPCPGPQICVNSGCTN